MLVHSSEAHSSQANRSQTLISRRRLDSSSELKASLSMSVVRSLRGPRRRVARALSSFATASLRTAVLYVSELPTHQCRLWRSHGRARSSSTTCARLQAKRRSSPSTRAQKSVSRRILHLNPRSRRCTTFARQNTCSRLTRGCLVSQQCSALRMGALAHASARLTCRSSFCAFLSQATGAPAEMSSRWLRAFSRRSSSTRSRGQMRVCSSTLTSWARLSARRSLELAQLSRRAA